MKLTFSQVVRLIWEDICRTEAAAKADIQKRISEAADFVNDRVLINETIDSVDWEDMNS